MQKEISAQTRDNEMLLDVMLDWATDRTQLPQQRHTVRMMRELSRAWRKQQAQNEGRELSDNDEVMSVSSESSLSDVVSDSDADEKLPLPPPPTQQSKKKQKVVVVVSKKNSPAKNAQENGLADDPQMQKYLDQSRAVLGRKYQTHPTLQHMQAAPNALNQSQQSDVIVTGTRSQLDVATTAATTQSQSGDLPLHTRRAVLEGRLAKYRNVEPNADGTYSLNARYGPVVLKSVGTIAFKDEQWHSERYIYPRGYTITREYASCKTLNAVTTYECTIRQGEDGGPLFAVTAQDSGVEYSGKSTSGAWREVMTQLYILKNGTSVGVSTSSVCGPDFYALSCSEIAKMIQELPGARDCKKYKWQQFVLVQ